MLGASFLPARFRTSETSSAPSTPNWLNRQITPVFQSISRPACTHPIHTIVFVALLASTTYIGLLEGSLFDSKALGRNELRPTDFNSLVEGGRRLKVGEETAWRWTIEDNGKQDNANEVRQTSDHEWRVLGRKRLTMPNTGRRSYSINDVCISRFAVK